MNYLDGAKHEAMYQAFWEGRSIRDVARSVGVAIITAAKFYWAMPDKPFCPCGKPITHREWCSHRFQRSPKRRKLMRRMQRERYKRKATLGKYLGGGWWEFWLSCGHGGKLLLGADWSDPISPMNCHPCRKS